ncbi:hypothetical protein MAR_000237, partial [Mya arenaria]
MIQVFRIVHNIDDISMTTFFTFADNSGTRGHNLKLFKPKARKSLRQISFSNRIVSTWNNLPRELVNTTSVNAFKAGLDKLWKNKRRRRTYRRSSLKGFTSLLGLKKFPRRQKVDK